MAKIALDGHKFNDVTNPNNHITCTTRDWNSCQSGGYWSGSGDDATWIPCSGGYDYTYNVNVSSTANGTVKGDTTTVFANTKKIARQNGKTNETDSYTSPSNIYGSVSGSHSNTEGTITGGNGRNVYAQGKLIAVNSGAITSHASRSTVISEGSNNVYIGG